MWRPELFGAIPLSIDFHKAKGGSPSTPMIWLRRGLGSFRAFRTLLHFLRFDDRAQCPPTCLGLRESPLGSQPLTWRCQTPPECALHPLTSPGFNARKV